MNMLSKAITIATKFHDGQTDKAGHPYILHPLRVMLKLYNDADRQVAVLHDIIEDTNFSLEDLRKEGFENNILIALDSITRKKYEKYYEKYFDYIDRVKQNYIAHKVKIADLEDNMNLSIIQYITDTDLSRMKRYIKAYSILKNYDVNDIKIERYHKGLEDGVYYNILPMSDLRDYAEWSNQFTSMMDIPFIKYQYDYEEERRFIHKDDIIMTINKKRKYIVSDISFLKDFNKYEEVRSY